MTQTNFDSQIIRVERDGILLIAGYQWMEEKAQALIDPGLAFNLLARSLSTWFFQTVKVLFTVDGVIHIPDRSRRSRLSKRYNHLPVVAEKRPVSAIQSIGSKALLNRSGHPFTKDGIPQYRVVIYFQDGGWCNVANEIPGEDHARLIAVQLQNAWADMIASINSAQAKAPHRRV